MPETLLRRLAGYSRLNSASATALGEARCRQLGRGSEWFCAVTEEGDEYLGISLDGDHLETYEIHPAGYCRRGCHGEVLGVSRTLSGLLPFAASTSTMSYLQTL